MARLTRKLALAIALAFVGGTVVPAAFSSPVLAHTGYASRADDDGADWTVILDGLPFKVRVLRPNQQAPAGGWPVIVYSAGNFTNRCANVNETYEGASPRASWYTRRQLVEHGFAVVSFNARGYPAAGNAGKSASGVSECNALDDAKDAIDDTGWDAGGPLDKGDLNRLIEWVATSYNPNTGLDDCADEPNPCINGNQFGILGAGLDAMKALHMGVPNPPENPSQFSSRVKAIVAVGFEELAIRNLRDVSDDGFGTARPVDNGVRPVTADMDIGYSASHAHQDVADHTMELLRSEYLNETVATATDTWFDNRTLVDDDPAVDKVGDIAVPTFFVHAFLDPDAYAVTAMIAHNKLGDDVTPTPNTNSYLYLGACGTTYSFLDATTPGPCASNVSTNATHLRDKVHAFFDTHVKDDPSNPVGAKVFWSVPPASPFSNAAWPVDSAPDPGWPPTPDANNGIVSLTYCMGGLGEFLDPPCAGTQNQSTRSITNTLSGAMTYGDFCKAQASLENEIVSYTSSPAGSDAKMLLSEAVVSIKSNRSRVQVVTDLVTVDPNGVETRAWQGNSQVVPVKRNGDGITTYRFSFIPAGTAWTVPAGHRLRLKIAARQRIAKDFWTQTPQELIPATYTISHTNGAPTQLTIVWDT